MSYLSKVKKWVKRGVFSILFISTVSFQAFAKTKAVVSQTSRASHSKFKNSCEPYTGIGNFGGMWYSTLNQTNLTITAWGDPVQYCLVYAPAPNCTNLSDYPQLSGEQFQTYRSKIWENYNMRDVVLEMHKNNKHIIEFAYLTDDNSNPPKTQQIGTYVNNWEATSRTLNNETFIGTWTSHADSGQDSITFNPQYDGNHVLFAFKVNSKSVRDEITIHNAGCNPMAQDPANQNCATFTCNNELLRKISVCLYKRVVDCMQPDRTEEGLFATVTLNDRSVKYDILFK